MSLTAHSVTVEVGTKGTQMLMGSPGTLLLLGLSAEAVLCLAAGSGLPLPHPTSQSPGEENSPVPKGALRVDWDPAPALCPQRGGGDANGSRSVTPGQRGTAPWH